MEINNQSNLKSNNIKMVKKKIVFKIKKKTQPKQNIKMYIINKKTPIKKVKKSIIKKYNPIDLRLLKTNKRDILKVLGYQKSITEAYRDFGLKKGDISANDLYEILINNYNSDLKYRNDLKERKKAFRELPKINFKKSKLRKYKKDIVLDESSALQGYAVSKFIQNTNNYPLIDGFNLTYKFIPFLRKSIQQLGNIKIKLNYKLMFRKDDGEENEFTLSSNFNKVV